MKTINNSQISKRSENTGQTAGSKMVNNENHNSGRTSQDTN